MPRIIEYPGISSSLDDSFSFIVDSETAGTRKLAIGNLLTRLLSMNDGDYIPNKLMVRFSINELENPSNNKYYAKYARPMSVYYVSSTSAYNNFNDLPTYEDAQGSGVLITLGDRNSTDGHLRAIQLYINIGSVLRSVYYRTLTASNNQQVASSWGLLGEHRGALPPMSSSSLTMRSSFTKIGDGGFVQEGTKTHLHLCVTRSYSSGFTPGAEIPVVDGLPHPAFGANYVPIPVILHDVENQGLNLFTFNAYVNSQGGLVLKVIDDGGASIQGTPAITFTFSGDYFTDAYT